MMICMNLHLKQKIRKKEYNAWDEGDNLVLTGSAGTGKTFVELYLAIESMLEKDTPYEKVIIVRSIVPTRKWGSCLVLLMKNKKCSKHHIRQFVLNCLVCQMIILQ